MEFSSILKRLRKEKGLTQEELAEKLSVKRSTIANYEVGKIKPSYDVMRQLADCFGVTIDYLAGKPDENQENIYKLLSEIKDLKTETNDVYTQLNNIIQQLQETDKKFLGKNLNDELKRFLIQDIQNSISKIEFMLKN